MSGLLLFAVIATIMVAAILLRRFLLWSSPHREVNGPTPASRSIDPSSIEQQRAQYSTASMVVDAIKLEMGRLRSDIVWTIENSALWDVSVPTSKAFFTALSVWDDYKSGWSVDETVTASAELKVLWKAAVDTAIRLGIDHLSATDRSKAATAIKLVRKAASTSSDAERHQLMSKAAEILSSVITITIPRETMKILESGGPHPELGEHPHQG